MVFLTIWFICLLVVRSYVCKFFVSMLVEVMFSIGLVCLLDGGYVLTLGMLSVLDFFITNLKVSHGF